MEDVVWFVETTDGGRPCDHPADGFAGPGKAYLWLQSGGLLSELGVSLRIVREDGARPATNTRVGAAVA